MKTVKGVVTAERSMVQNRTGISIGHIQKEDWRFFLRLAADEGWRVSQQETELFCGAFTASAFVIRAPEGPCGFVTAVCHECNGWIGNLLIANAYRGRGYGGALLDHAIQSLRERGARCVWLTASELGQPLYERRGFFLIDGIDRWAREGEGVSVSSNVAVIDVEAVIAADARVWGGSRAPLLRRLAVEAKACGGGESLALLQAPAPMRVLGPWLGEAGDDVAAVLSAAVAMTSAGVEIVTDVRRSAGLDTRLEQAGFQWQGYNALMAQGATDQVDLSRVLSLASLGSMG